MKVSKITDQNGRKNNEDVYTFIPKIIDGKKTLCALVSDGMGGTDAGEIASGIAKEGIEDWFSSEGDKCFDGTYSLADLKDSLTKRVTDLNKELKKWEEQHGQSLGCTMVLLLLCEGEYIVANIGDSRCYKFGSRNLQITKDHTLTQRELDAGHLTEEQAKTDSGQHKLTRCLGMAEAPAPDFFKGKYSEGDFFLLCSDGMYNRMELEELKEIVLSKGEGTAKKLQLLCDAAKKKGETDNITGILINA